MKQADRIDAALACFHRCRAIDIQLVRCDQQGALIDFLARRRFLLWHLGLEHDLDRLQILNGQHRANHALLACCAGRNVFLNFLLAITAVADLVLYQRQRNEQQQCHQADQQNLEKQFSVHFWLPRLNDGGSVDGVGELPTKSKQARVKRR